MSRFFDADFADLVGNTKSASKGGFYQSKSVGIQLLSPSILIFKIDKIFFSGNSQSF